jgi:branched-chain amino acid transport system substrate-binding protein
VYSRRKVVQGLACVAAIALSVGASSSSKKTASVPSGAQGPTAFSAAAAVTRTPIEIGAICTCSGPLAEDNGDIPLVYKAWVASVNAAGGINGHPPTT